MASSVGGNLYAEIQRRHDPDEEARNDETIALARSFQLPAIGNTREISAQLTLELSDLSYEFPHYPVPHGQTEE